jgi:hypothetical protein
MGMRGASPPYAGAAPHGQQKRITLRAPALLAGDPGDLPPAVGKLAAFDAAIAQAGAAATEWDARAAAAAVMALATRAL